MPFRPNRDPTMNLRRKDRPPRKSPTPGLWLALIVVALAILVVIWNIGF